MLSTPKIPNCDNVDFDQTHTDRLGELNKADLDDLYTNCSLQRSCSYTAPRQETINFSVVKYMCIKEPKVLCNDETFHEKNTSLIWNDKSISNVDETCSCNISTNGNELVVFAFDMRPQTACPKLSITTPNGTTKPNCRRLISSQLFANSTLPIVLEPVNVFNLLWISVIGSINVSCTKHRISQEGQSSITILGTPFAHFAAPPEQENIRAIAGTVTLVIIICIIVAGVLVWRRFIRNKTQCQKPEVGMAKHVVAGSATAAVINDDYATIDDGVDPMGRSQNDLLTAKALKVEDYNHINHNPPKGDKSSGYDTTASAVAAEKKLKHASSYSTDDDGYNRINHNTQQGTKSPGYDTTALGLAAVKKLNKASSNSTDNDGYNHLGDGKPSVVSSDYDTTVSASKAVAQLREMKDSEDDYDHFKRSEDRVIDLPYDTANHHIGVSADTTTNPYDLAK